MCFYGTYYDFIKPNKECYNEIMKIEMQHEDNHEEDYVNPDTGVAHDHDGDGVADHD